jgi:hypothetical protein
MVLIKVLVKGAKADSPKLKNSYGLWSIVHGLHFANKRHKKADSSKLKK